MELADIAILRMARVSALDPGPIGYHLPRLLPDHLRVVGDVYRVPVAFGHLSPVGAWKHWHLSMQFAWLGEHVTAIVIESPYDFPSELHMRRLIFADRDVVG